MLRFSFPFLSDIFVHDDNARVNWAQTVNCIIRDFFRARMGIAKSRTKRQLQNLRCGGADIKVLIWLLSSSVLNYIKHFSWKSKLWLIKSNCCCVGSLKAKWNLLKITFALFFFFDFPFFFGTKEEMFIFSEWKCFALKPHISQLFLQLWNAVGTAFLWNVKSHVHSVPSQYKIIFLRVTRKLLLAGTQHRAKHLAR